MTKPLPLFDFLLPDEGEEAGVQEISLVAQPAIIQGFIALAAQVDPAPAPRFHFSTEGPAKQVLTGPVLIPDVEIYRVDEATGQPYNGRFTRDEIEQIAAHYMQRGITSQTRLEHELDLTTPYVMESWLVSDLEDKSRALGLDLPPGSWCISMKVPEPIWSEQVLTGKVRGFSLGGSFERQLVNAQLRRAQALAASSKPNPMLRFLTQLSQAIRAAFTTDVNLSLVALEDGTPVEITPEGQAFRLDEAGNRLEPLADGAYTLADGSELTIQGGLVVQPQAPQEQAAETQPQEPEVNPLQAQLDALQAQVNDLTSQLLASQQARTALSAQVADLETKLATEPGTKPVKLSAKLDDKTLTPAQRRMAQLRGQL